MFKNFFKKQQPAKTPKPESTPMCSINFELNSDSTVNIVCFWPDFNENNTDTMDYVSQEYASLIFMITSGFFNSEILKTLDSLINENNPNDYLFINSILKNWAKLLDLQKKHSEPSVRPLMVFKHSTAPK
jgi:hypothetical protein